VKRSNKKPLIEVAVSAKCNNGKRICKYLGDLPDICTKYCKGERNGDPIIDRNVFPMLCQECNDRDFYWCKRHSDLVCFIEQDPYYCKIDLTKDMLRGAELIKFRNEAIDKACKKWGSPLTKK